MIDHSQTLHVCHICLHWNGVNVGIYGVRGVSGTAPDCLEFWEVKGPAFVKAIEKPKISKAISAPPAALAPPAPTRVLGQLGADVLRAAFMPKALEMKAPGGGAWH